MIRHHVFDLNRPRYNQSGNTFSIEKYFFHSKYNGNAYFDIAVIQIASVNFSENLRPVCLPNPTNFETNRYDERSATLISWGTYYPAYRRATTIKKTIWTIYGNRYAILALFI